LAKEYLLESNKFQTPRILKDKDSAALLLTRLLLREPGSSQIEPKMGIGLVSKYRYIQDTGLEDLRSNITNQISTYLPNFIGVNVSVNLNEQNELIVEITVDDTLYSFTANDNGIQLSQL
jgi:hypothetical protein